jgi:hypothetical protein
MYPKDLKYYEDQVLKYKQRVEEARNRYTDELSYLDGAEEDLRKANWGLATGPRRRY